jgi:hypothetical protein
MYFQVNAVNNKANGVVSKKVFKLFTGRLLLHAGF